MVKKKANAILTETYIGKTYKEYRKEFVEHFPYGKQIGEILDLKNMQKRHRAPKHIFWSSKSSKSSKSVFFDNVRNEAMLAIVFYFFSKTCYMWRFTDV